MFGISTRREGRLWAAVAIVVIAIYSTLGLARTWVDALGPDLRTAGFAAGMILVAGAILLQAGRVRLGGRELGVAVGILTVYFLVFLRMTIPEERSHLIEYGVVGVLILEALIERHGRLSMAPAGLAVVLTAAVGTIDEVLQLLIPERVFDPRDILFNVLAGVMAVASSSALRFVRDRRTNQYT